MVTESVTQPATPRSQLSRTRGSRRNVRRGPRGARRNRWIGLAFVAPGLLIYALVVLASLLRSMSYSFYSWDGVTQATWVGLRNYETFFTDPDLRGSLGHVLVLIVFFSLLPILLGLLAAALLGRPRPGAAVFRWILFLPQVITSVVIAIIWKRMYAPDGPVNATLRAIGLGRLAHNWLGDFAWALPALGVIGSWVTFGFCMLLFTAGISAIPTELYEAAAIDGANAFRRFTAVTLPGLRAQIGVALVLTVTGALRTFDLVWITTKGGPGTSSMTPAVLLYRAAFENPQVGLASAIGVIMAVLCLAVALVINRVAERGT
ncbi:carbohydrate ABC transporter permease [Dactylosporangium sp. CA-233914]|uniref:carbohydrate ABC transporter permease n=1 Tax=Dactylosporangium sp. CA-233914 TaxID=3239934 RepID=UPI003D9292D7